MAVSKEDAWFGGCVVGSPQADNFLSLSFWEGPFEYATLEIDHMSSLALAIRHQPTPDISGTEP